MGIGGVDRHSVARRQLGQGQRDSYETVRTGTSVSLNRESASASKAIFQKQVTAGFLRRPPGTPEEPLCKGPLRSAGFERCFFPLVLGTFGNMRCMRRETTPIVTGRSPDASTGAISSCFPRQGCALTDSPRHQGFANMSAFLVVLLSWCCAAWGEPLRGPSQAQAGEPQRREERVDLHGDRLPAGAVARFGTLRFWLGYSIDSLAFSPDGENLAAASAGYSLTLRVWEANSGRTAHILPAPVDALPSGNGVRTVAFSPSGNSLAAACDDGCIRIWDWPSGRLSRVTKAHEGFVSCIAFAPDGKSLASGGEEGDVKLWDFETGKEIRAFPRFRDGVIGVAFCPVGPTLAAAFSDRTVCLWNITTGDEQRRFTPKTRTHGIAVGPDGKKLALLAETHIQVQELQTGKEIWRTRAGAGDSFRSIVFSPDGKTIASGSELGELGLWEAASGREIRRIAVRHSVDAVALSPDGARIASGGDIRARLWDVATGKEIFTYTTHDGAVSSFAFSPDEKTLASTSDDGFLRLWDVATGKELQEFALGRRRLTGPVAFTHDGRVLTWATSTWDGKEGAVQSWEVGSGKLVHRIALEATRETSRMAFSPDATTIAGVGEEGVLVLWDTATGKVLRRKTIGRDTKVYVVEFSRDCERVATSGDGGVVENWDARTLQPLRRFSASHDTILSLSFSPDGRVIGIGGADAVLRLWTADGAKELWRTPARPNPDDRFIRTVAFSADGRKTAWGGDDQTVRVWDVREGRELRQLHGHQDGITTVVFSPSSRYLASGSGDGTILIWDAAQASK